jgi:hypothetical protein
MAEETLTSSTIRQAPYLEDVQKRILEMAMARGETPVDIPDITVAGQDPYTTQAYNNAAQISPGGIGDYLPYLNKGVGTTDLGLATLQNQYAGIPQQYADASTAASTSYGAPTTEQLQNYMDPYAQLVSQDALTEMNRQRDMAANQIRANQVGQGAFGGARGELELAELQRNATEQQGRRYYEDMSRNFTQAQNAFQNQQTRQQNAASLMGNIGAQQGQTGSQLAQGIGQFGTAQSNYGNTAQGLLSNQQQLLSQFGAQNQQQAQRELDAQRQTDLQQAYEPFQRISYTSDIFKPNIGSASSSIGMNVAPSPSPFSQFMGAGVAGLGINKALGDPFGILPAAT